MANATKDGFESETDDSQAGVRCAATNDCFEPILWKNNVLLLQKVWF